MAKRVHCEKKTKIYIPKTTNPQIISYRPYSDLQSGIVKPENNVGSTQKQG